MGNGRPPHCGVEVTHAVGKSGTGSFLVGSTDVTEVGASASFAAGRC